MNRRSRATRATGAAVTAVLACGLLATPAVAGGEKTTTTSANHAEDPTTFGTMSNIAKITGAQDAWKAGFTGKGVDVALIDTGVAPVPGLTSGNVINGPDLSFDSQEPGLQHLDAFGHGTHMAGLIVGRDVPQSDPGKYAIGFGGFTGMAPDARLISIKAGAADGGVDVTQVLAALNWVAEHGQKDGLDIKVVSLSYGTDSTQDYRVDPLAHAVETLHRKGITVVVAGGNDGSDKTYLGMPAQDPFSIAVGAQDPRGTLDVKDDTVPAFANRGDNKRPVDFVAPAVSVQSLRVPHSLADLEHPSARSGERFFRGSGTSQAAAIVAGAAALYLQKFPTATPDQVKYALMTSAQNFSEGGSASKGAGAVNIGRAMAKLQNYKLNAEQSTGTGSIELSRGSIHVAEQAEDGTWTPLTGENDPQGPLSTETWAAATTAGTTWAGGDWMGRSWTGSTWTSADWTGRSWTGRSWTGRSWTGRSWTGRSWTGRSWTSGAWDGRSWTGEGWTGRSWTGRSWTSAGWAQAVWE